MTEQAPQHHSYQPDEIEAMLAVATTGEPGASTTNPALNLSHLTPHEIVGAVHAVKEASSRVPKSRYDERIPTEQDERLYGYESDIDSAFEELPKFVGLEKARDVFTMLTGSPSPLDRGYAASYIGGLTEPTTITAWSCGSDYSSTTTPP